MANTAPIDLLPPHLNRIRALSGSAGSSGGSSGAKLSLTIRGDGAVLPAADVTLYARGRGRSQRTYYRRSGTDGKVHFQVETGFTPAIAIATPAGGYWTATVRGPEDDSAIDCIALPRTGPGGWWHERLGIDPQERDRGKGIKVGVVDTGCGPHPNLNHVRLLGAFVDNQFHSDAKDIGQHGTHTTGIIGAKPNGSGDYEGISPACDLFHVRAFSSTGRGANQADIIQSIQELCTHECDIINLSLGSPVASEIEHDAIIDAFQRGTLCICAAGNSAGPIAFPAAFPETVAVSALGLAGAAPAGTLSSTRLPEAGAQYGLNNIYLANFSCFGPELACAAPGVGIISTVPVQAVGQPWAYLAMDGTSMAAPAVCGALAVMLSRDPAYLGMAAEEDRSRAAHAILTQLCQTVGLSVDYEGRGMPFVANVLRRSY